MCHQKRELFWNKKIKGLNDDFRKKDETFWNKWENFSETSVNKHVVINDGEQWENYYKNLLTERNKNYNKLNDEELPYNIDLNKEITLDEVKKILKKLKKKKAVGLDRLSNEIIKNTPIYFIEIILQVFNKCLKTGDIPKIWCFGLITPIYKKGNKLNPDNYKGICVMNALLNVLCLTLNERLQKTTSIK